VKRELTARQGSDGGRQPAARCRRDEASECVAKRTAIRRDEVAARLELREMDKGRLTHETRAGERANDGLPPSEGRQHVYESVRGEGSRGGSRNLGDPPEVACLGVRRREEDEVCSIAAPVRQRQPKRVRAAAAEHGRVTHEAVGMKELER
jgi:hypothetical protein